MGVSLGSCVRNKAVVGGAGQLASCAELAIRVRGSGVRDAVCLAQDGGAMGVK